MNTNAGCVSSVRLSMLSDECADGVELAETVRCRRFGSELSDESFSLVAVLAVSDRQSNYFVSRCRYIALPTKSIIPIFVSATRTSALRASPLASPPSAVAARLLRLVTSNDCAVKPPRKITSRIGDVTVVLASLLAPGARCTRGSTLAADDGDELGDSACAAQPLWTRSSWPRAPLSTSPTEARWSVEAAVFSAG